MTVTKIRKEITNEEVHVFISELALLFENSDVNNDRILQKLHRKLLAGNELLKQSILRIDRKNSQQAYFRVLGIGFKEIYYQIHLYLDSPKIKVYEAASTLRQILQQRSLFVGSGSLSVDVFQIKALLNYLSRPSLKAILKELPEIALIFHDMQECIDKKEWRSNSNEDCLTSTNELQLPKIYRQHIEQLFNSDLKLYLQKMCKESPDKYVKFSKDVIKLACLSNCTVNTNKKEKEVIVF